MPYLLNSYSCSSFTIVKFQKQKTPCGSLVFTITNRGPGIQEKGGGGLHTRWRSHRDRCLVHITTHPEWRQDSKTYGLLQEPMTGLRGIYTHFSISQRYKKKLLTPAHYALSSGLRELKLVFIRAINNLEVLFFRCSIKTIIISYK